MEDSEAGMASIDCICAFKFATCFSSSATRGSTGADAVVARADSGAGLGVGVRVGFGAGIEAEVSFRLEVEWSLSACDAIK